MMQQKRIVGELQAAQNEKVKPAANKREEWED
jgi:hypothetical protein